MRTPVVCGKRSRLSSARFRSRCLLLLRCSSGCLFRWSAGYDRAQATLDRLIYRIIADRRNRPDDRGDLLSMLLLASDAEQGGERMTDRQVRDEAMTIFLAGHETTANALSWTWNLLAAHPDVERRLHDEIDQVLGDRSATVDDAPRLAYTRMVIAESMRRYPPAWGIGRRAIEDFAIGGYQVPKGTVVLVSQYLLHHDARFFPDPERFDPDRWLPERQTTRPKFAYFPFGGGSPRVHRRTLRMDGGNPGARHARAAVAARASRHRSDSDAARHHAAAGNRNPHGGQGPTLVAATARPRSANNHPAITKPRLPLPNRQRASPGSAYFRLFLIPAQGLGIAGIEFFLNDAAMEFRDYAAKETLALLTRLLAGQAEVSMQQLRALRESLEAAERALEASPQVDGDVQELVGRLNNAAGAVVRRIREEARAAIDAAQTQLEQLRSEHTSVTAARDEAEAHVRTLEHDLHEERGRAESVERDLDAARDAQARVEAALQEAEAGRHHEADARASAETALASARVQIDASVIEVARLTSQLETEIAEHLNISDELASFKKANAQIEADRAEAEAFATREAQARVEVESELRTVRDLFDSAVSDAAAQQTQLDGALNEVARLGGQLEAESNENISLKGDLAAAREARDHLEGSLSAAEQRADRESDARSSIEHELHEVRAGLDASLSESAALATQLESAVSEKGRLQRDLAAVQVELETAQAQRDAMAAQFKAATARIRTLERDHAKRDDILSDLEARLASATDAESGLRERAEMSERDRNDAHEEAVLLRDERDRLVSLLHVSVEGIDALVSATTVGDLLAALAERLAIQFPRVAVFRYVEITSRASIRPVSSRPTTSPNW